MGNFFDMQQIFKENSRIFFIIIVTAALFLFIYFWIEPTIDSMRSMIGL